MGNKTLTNPFYCVCEEMNTHTHTYKQTINGHIFDFKFLRFFSLYIKVFVPN